MRRTDLKLVSDLLRWRVSRLRLSCADDDEQVPRVPVPEHSKARQYCLARQYSGHDALPVDCKFPSSPIVELIGTAFDPPSLAWYTPQRQYTHVQAYFLLPPKILRVLPVERRDSGCSGSVSQETLGRALQTRKPRKWWTLTLLPGPVRVS